MSAIQSEYDILQDKITELLQLHQQRNGVLSAIYQRAITEDVLAMIDSGLINESDIEGAIIDLERKLQRVTDNVAYQVLNRAQDLIKVQQYFWQRHGYALDLAKEYERLRAIQANTFDAFAGIPPSTSRHIRDMLRDNEIMGKGKAAVNDEIRRITGVTASRAQLISGTSEFLYIGQFNANKAADLGVQRFRYKPGFVIPTSRPFSRWAVDHGDFTREEIDAIDRHDWKSVPGLPLDKTGNGWQGMIPGVPVLVQGGGYNSIHRFAMVFMDGPAKKVTQPLPLERWNMPKVTIDRGEVPVPDNDVVARMRKQTVSDDVKAQRIRMSEDAIRHRDYETLIIFDADGNEVRNIRGEKRSVNLPPDAESLLPGSIVTHNHPGGTSFSPQDLMAAKVYGVKEMRVASARHDYSATITDAGMAMSERDFNGLAYDTSARYNVEYHRKYAAGEMSADDVNHLLWHSVWEDFRNLGLINYTKTER